ncbi:MAG: pyridoxamine 5'-phosphate oxidase family protein [Verrucomicrobiota bacterium]|nr:pyridoxamine 5'-phosphate oxidase family protein [Verrucomicrobiota bacterium]
MPPPTPKPFSPDELIDLAHAVIKNARFPMLATVAGDQPRLRPVSPVRVDGFTIYVANLRQYGKTREIAANPRVELCYLDEHHDQVRITGVAEVLTDERVIAEIWETNPLLRKYLGTPDNPELIIYRIRPERVRFMREWALEYHEVRMM